MKNNKKTQQTSHFLKKMLWLAVPIGIVFILVSIYAFSEMKRLNDEAIQNSIKVYQTDINHELEAVSHFVQFTVAHDHILDNFYEGNTMGALTLASAELRSRVNDAQYATRTDYHYFFYWETKDMFVNASAATLDYKTYTEIKNKLKRDSKNLSNSHIIEWSPYVFNDKTYLYYSVSYNDFIFASAITMEDLAKPLQNINIGTDGNIQYIYDNKIFYETNEKPTGLNGLMYSQIFISESDSKLPFSINIYTDVFSHYGHVFFLLFLIFLLALIFSSVLGMYILFTYRKIIMPIRIFSNNLAKMDSISSNEPTSLIINDSSVQELNQINEQFKNLMHEITRLKINIYEVELENNNFLIHFLQQQIKPHFYLNCLTTIDSMLSIGEIDTAKKMLHFTSQYLRYLFQADLDFINLSSELAHIEDYINIQNLRLGQTIHYQVNTKDEYASVKVPPLLLITFIENIIKHAIPTNNYLDIMVSCSKYECNSDALRDKFNSDYYFEISILDNGQGIDEETLKKINKGETISKDGKHLGISNSYRRLKLLYDSHFDLKLTNHELFGAKVILRIPFITE